MGWKRFVTLALVFLFLGMTVSGASATASFANSTTNSTIGISSEQGFHQNIVWRKPKEIMFILRTLKQ